MTNPATAPVSLPERALGSPRLALLPLRVVHATEMAEALSDPALYVFIGGAPPGEEELRARYERLTAGAPDPHITWCNWVLQLRTTARLVGTVQATLTSAPDRPPTAEIAWIVGSPWQGRGRAVEAARALVAALGDHGVRVVRAHVHPDHRASAAVAAAAGLRPTEVWQDGEIRWERAPAREQHLHA